MEPADSEYKYSVDIEDRIEGIQPALLHIYKDRAELADKDSEDRKDEQLAVLPISKNLPVILNFPVSEYLTYLSSCSQPYHNLGLSHDLFLDRDLEPPSLLPGLMKTGFAESGTTVSYNYSDLP